MRKIIRASRTSAVNISEVVLEKKTGKTVSIISGNKPFVIQTPLLKVIELRKTQVDNIYILLTVVDDGATVENNHFLKFIDNIENKICDEVIKHGKTWFTKKDIRIKSLIQETDNNNIIKWPIYVENNIFYDEDKKSFDIMTITDSSQIKLIVEMPYIWLNDDQFGIATTIKKGLVKACPVHIQNEYIFDGSDDSDNNDDVSDKMISVMATEKHPNSYRAVKIDMEQDDTCPERSSITTPDLVH